MARADHALEPFRFRAPFARNPGLWSNVQSLVATRAASAGRAPLLIVLVFKIAGFIAGGSSCPREGSEKARICAAYHGALSHDLTFRREHRDDR